MTRKGKKPLARSARRRPPPDKGKDELRMRYNLSSQLGITACKKHYPK